LMNNNLARATFSFPDGRKIERSRAKLSRLEGIHSVGVSVLTQMVYVEYDPREITIEKIRTALKRVR
jgi:Heavy-metal-associated domain